MGLIIMHMSGPCKPIRPMQLSFFLELTLPKLSAQEGFVIDWRQSVLLQGNVSQGNVLHNLRDAFVVPDDIMLLMQVRVSLKLSIA